MPTVTPTIALEMQFTGSGWLLGENGFSELGTTTSLTGSWVDVTNDVIISNNVTAQYGIRGSGANDRVASTGTLTFQLDNSVNNSGGVVGYYSPNNVNVRSGFNLGIGVRLSITFGGYTYYKWSGFLNSIEPLGGVKRQRVTNCIALDWMDTAASAKLSQVALQINKRSDEVFTAVYNNLARPAPSVTTGTGASTFAFALDNVQDESTTVLSAFQTIAASEVGFIYVKGNTTLGGELVFENRTARQVTSSSATINNDMLEMSTSRSIKDLMNDIKVETFPRLVDAASTSVLYLLQNANTSITGGATLSIDASYTDPNQKASRVGGTAMVTPVAFVDYLMNTQADGSGSDLTASLSIVETFGANSAKLVLTNNSSQTGFLTLLKLRGKGIYTYDHTISSSIDASSQYDYGINTLSYSMPYEDTLTVGQNAADYFLSLYKDPLTYMSDITIDGNMSSQFMTYIGALEPSSRITVTETVTGLNNDYFINGVDLVISAGNHVRATYTLVPAFTNLWILGTSTLGVDTVLGF